VSRPTVAPYGSWRSPISAERVAVGALRLSQVSVRGDTVTWHEARPAEGGRAALVRADPWTSPVDLIPDGFNVRTKVHEYGGGDHTVHGGSVIFANFADQRLYRLDPGADPVAITPTPAIPGGDRFADMRVSPDGRLVVCVRERHTGEGLPDNELVMVPADGETAPWVVATGRDFYACPRFAPDGSRLVWLEWDFPRMPWDGTEMMVAELEPDGSLGPAHAVAGGANESVFQPAWGPDGRLHFVSDRTGWWNLYRAEEDGAQTNLTPMSAEFGVPLWELGYSTYAFLDDGRIVCSWRGEGVHHLGMLDPETSELLELDLPFTCFEPSIDASGTRVAFVGSSPTEPAQVVTLDVATRAVDVLRVSEELGLDAAGLSVPEPIAFPTEGGTAYAYHYPPANPDFGGPAGSSPPLIVRSHGGPTGETTPGLDLEIQYFTSRGFAVVDVNYGGSTGYGRAFRERLYGRWGVVDVIDCINAARYLVDRGLADPDRLVVTGGSAGGWTTLCALTFHDAFACGTSYYGVADLEPFATFTHKFELRYTDTLVGPWPEAADLWRARSPARHADLLSRPVLLLQGLEDEVVPPSQAEIMVRALERKGIPHAYLAFEGEQHGFRGAETIVRCLQAELAFYGRILGFEPADELPPLEIRHLPDRQPRA
jgi:dipeptidyl aminopeptidase/acylaminoacyl peptidase